MHFHNLFHAMKILLTGNRGYIGAVLAELLLEKCHEVIGYDSCFYDGCELYKFEQPIRQIKKDIRDISNKDLDGVNAVIHLAALSNDPLGELDQKLTEEINFKATIKLANYAMESGTRRFVFASSQSMYGISEAGILLDEDNSIKNPLTVYAATKWQAEEELKKLCSDDFTVVCMRPSTVFGASPSLRCDIVFNNLVACAYATGKIEIKSDGTPWRPVVHIRDASKAFIAALEAPKNLVSGQSFNIGMPNGNYTVRELAEAAQHAVPGSTLMFTNEHTDSRTYRVSFNKILNIFKDYYKPEWDIDKGAKELIEMFNKTNFTEQQFRGRNCNRLKQINHLLETGQIGKDLRWLE